VTASGVVVVLVNVSLIFPTPAFAVWLIPATAARLHANVDPGVALVGLYVKAAALQMSAGVNVELRTGIGLTTTVTLNVVAFVHPFALTVYTYVTVVLMTFPFLSVSLIAPLPPAAPAGVMPPRAARAHVKEAPGVLLVGV
jgi:hypothetical protein